MFVQQLRKKGDYPEVKAGETGYGKRQSGSARRSVGGWTTGWWPGAHPAILLLPSSTRGENRMKKLTG